MAETVSQTLSEDLLAFLRQERFVTLATIDYETGAPSLHSLSWIYAVSAQRIFLAIDSRSRILANIAKHPEVVIQLIGGGSSYAVNGLAQVKTQRIEEVPLKLALVEMNIYSVRDIMFYGSRISADPQYEKTYDKKAAAKLDQQVMAALRKAESS